MSLETVMVGAVMSVGERKTKKGLNRARPDTCGGGSETPQAASRCTHLRTHGPACPRRLAALSIPVRTGYGRTCTLRCSRHTHRGHRWCTGRGPLPRRRWEGRSSCTLVGDGNSDLDIFLQGRSEGQCRQGEERKPTGRRHRHAPDDDDDDERHTHPSRRRRSSGRRWRSQRGWPCGRGHRR